MNFCGMIVCDKFCKLKVSYRLKFHMLNGVRRNDRRMVCHGYCKMLDKALDVHCSLS